VVHHTEFPVDLPDAPKDDDQGLRWTATVIGIATVLLLLTNAIAISSWGAEQPPSARMVRIVNAADGWHAFTDRTGLGAAREGLHQLWKQMEKLRWPGQKPAGGDQR
jgi:hypothetical protein